MRNWQRFWQYKHQKNTRKSTALNSLLLFLILLFPHGALAGDCQEFFQAPLTRASYVSRQAQIRPSVEETQPEFVDAAREIQLAEEVWKSEKGPRLLQAMLPEGVGFISHQLKDNDGAGYIKSAHPGKLVYLRLETQKDGQMIGTNISVPFNIVQNLGREDKWLIGPDAEAGLVWTHGGGTGTTGQHTGVSLLNYFFEYGIDTLSMDQPWHAYGFRTHFDSARDYFGFMKELVARYTHPDVPKVKIGHSMGGLFTDMMMRMSDDPEMGLGETFKAYVPLSGVVDQAPGGDFEQKHLGEQAAAKIQNQPELQERMAPMDREIGEKLRRDGKVAALAMMFTEFMGFYNDWSEPEHGGKLWSPSFYVWGDGDFLYVGNEEAIDEHVGQLENARLKVIDRRKDRNGDSVIIGHLIMDHSRPGTDRPEVFEDVHAFIQEVLNKELPRQSQRTNLGSLAIILQNYANDLSFREFAKEHEIIEFLPQDKFKEVSQRMAQLAAFNKHASQILKRKQIKEAEAKENFLASERIRLQDQIGQAEAEGATNRLESLQHELELVMVPGEGGNPLSLAEAQSEMQALSKLQKREWIPKDPQLAQFAKENLEKRQKIQAEEEQINKGKNEGKKAVDRRVKELINQRRTKRSRLRARLDQVVATEALEEAQKREEAAYQAYVEADIQVRDRIKAFFSRVNAQGGLSAERLQGLTEDLREVSLLLGEAKAKYFSQMEVRRVVEKEEALSGRLGSEIQQLAVDLYGAQGESGLELQIKQGYQELNQIEGRLQELGREKNRLLAAYVERVMPDYFEVRISRLWDILEGGDSPEYAEQHSGVLQKALSDWNSLADDHYEPLPWP